MAGEPRTIDILFEGGPNDGQRRTFTYPAPTLLVDTDGARYVLEAYAQGRGKVDWVYGHLDPDWHTHGKG